MFRSESFDSLAPYKQDQAARFGIAGLVEQITGRPIEFSCISPGVQKTPPVIGHPPPFRIAKPHGLLALQPNPCFPFRLRLKPIQQRSSVPQARIGPPRDPMSNLAMQRRPDRGTIGRLSTDRDLDHNCSATCHLIRRICATWRPRVDRYFAASPYISATYSQLTR